MITISLCMIVKNEELSLPRCLASVADLVDEIIVVDTGSTDATRNIAASFGARVVDFAWVDDFSAARNFAFEQATMTFILWLDADDVLEEKDRRLFRELRSQEDLPYESVTMDYHLTLDSAGNPVHSLKRNRLVRRSCGFQWHGPVHEYLAVAGRVLHSEIAVTHRKERLYTDRNLRIYQARLAAGEPFSPRDRYYFANELLDHSQHAEAAETYELFLEEGLGWIEDNIAACYKLADCYAVLEQPQRQMTALLRTLAYDAPRAEFCCKIGAIWADRGHYANAIYWYRQAALLEKRQDVMGLSDQSAWTWLPHLQLTYCYDRLGERAKALIHHEIAKLHHPLHPSIVHNDTYFNEADGA
ncbi:glycosyltransferase family 2 protein [Paenibacillus athensensis]|uniref:Glycosyl transferase n=1 Tax=Paenibacillus athensensis TaxID=1967502 RepID=A0A4Y8PTS5_9BACL|nr:glycosyltransferase family 2 protein [Paenibacillus athensensis]MCD1258796.1 glycosyltransferase family 2 protein [Paenibacillus athensensis]